MTARSSVQRRDIQGLRALAVTAVVLDHAFGWPSGGYAGVDVFFVLSGFLITGMLIRDVQDHGHVRFGHFYAARVRRILPVALLALIVVTVLGFAVFNTQRAQQTLTDGVWAAVFAINWRFATQGTDYFAADGPVSPLQHFWTLSVEEQFYLFWPVLVVLLVLLLPQRLRRGAAARAVIGCGALTIVGASLWWGAVQTVTAPTAAYFSTATRAWELAAGAALAALVPILRRVPPALGGLAGWVGLGGVVLSLFILRPESAMPVPAALLPVGATLLVLAGGVAGDPRHRWLFPLTNPVSTFVGDMSYSVYVWHFPVIIFAAVLLPMTPATAAVELVVIAVVSIVCYLGIEQPLHRSPLLRSFRAAPAVDAGAVPASTELARAVSPPASAEGAGAVPSPAPEPAASAPRIDTRPPGWQPGRRYFPGSALSSAAAAQPPAPAAPPEEAVLALRPPAATRWPDPQRSGAHDHDADDAALPLDTPRQRRRAAWASWRARYRTQAASALGGLVVSGLAVLLALQYITGSSLLPRIDLTPAAAADQSDGTAADVTSMEELQAQLADAVNAGSWPRLTPSMDKVLADGSGSNPAAPCFSPDVEPDIAACTWGDPAAPHHLYLVGDSTAMAYAPGFRRIAETSGGTWRITTVGLYGCRFTDILVANDGTGVMDACPGRKDRVAAAIAADKPDAVVVTNAYRLGRATDGRDLSPQDLAASVQAETARYGMPGRVVYLAPPPVGASPAICYSRATGPASCLTTVDQTWRDMAAATTAAATAAGERVVDSLPLVCWQEVCPAFAGTTPMRYDPTHLTPAYAEKIAPVLQAELVTAGVM